MTHSLQRKAAVWARGVEHVSAWAAGLCLTLNVGVIVFAVVARYGFDVSPIWTEELARYALIWSVLLAGAAALRRGEHMQIRIVVDRLPPRVAVVVQTFRRLVVLAILIFMTVMGAYYAQKVSAMTTLAMNVSRSVPTASIPAGMGLMVLQYLLILLAGPAGRNDTEVVP
ncbi:TRAP transporter small permease [Rhodovibrio salinarum]|uniref:TRAP transporter small permease protein n=1 Tax=Rhodovibrio salinarum TaxID=1087 RepID=A0A934QJR5_9PROT|nr:TRAP transporter small permease [Rhodovibrio salinarum]MBK1698163.1 TRAP transporter small permease [Rhodovibrio salinarum]